MAGDQGVDTRIAQTSEADVQLSWLTTFVSSKAVGGRAVVSNQDVAPAMAGLAAQRFYE